ncbi:MAG TPA: 2-hydroxyacyl-CoA dehydratase family protein [Candidatus Dormibacteraeota bacterium]|nr:2-hydroxyacyl-CoA dehydratase family protein [Candidatus Dormibacteraeota bacterium]
MSAAAELQRHYRDRTAAARAASARGRKVVGLVGSTVPTELVLASDAYPLTVAAAPGGPTPNADRYLERHIEDDTRATLEALLTGAYAWLDLLVLSRAWDSHLELYYTLKEIVRLGEGHSIPPLSLYDLLHGRTPANRAYGLDRIRELRSRLAALTGVTATDQRLRAAIRAVNGQRAALRRLAEARRDPAAGISGKEALAVIGAGRFLEPAVHEQLLLAYLAEERPRLEARLRLLVVPGAPLSDLRLHTLLEEAGAVVVAEDDSWGSRSAGADVPEDAADPLGAVFDAYFLHVPSPRVAPAAARDEWLRSELAKGGVDAVVFFIPRSDHWFGWDYPRLKSLVEAAGLPALLVRDLEREAVVDALTAGVRGR